MKSLCSSVPAALLILGQLAPSHAAYSIAVNKKMFLLMLIEDGRRIEAVYPVAIGRGVPGWPATPEGNFRIENKSLCPRGCGPYGTRFMGLVPSRVGIHGTNQPWKIGTRASHGCIRMHNRHVEDLFEKVPVGTAVFIYSQAPYRQTFQIDDAQVSVSCLPTSPTSIKLCQLRPLVEELSFYPLFDESTLRIRLEHSEGRVVELQSSRPGLRLKGVLDETLEAPVLLFKQTTYAPVAGLLQALGYELTADNTIRPLPSAPDGDPSALSSSATGA